MTAGGSTGSDDSGVLRRRTSRAGFVDRAEGEQLPQYAMQTTAPLQFSHPMENGIVKDWDEMEKVWDHVFTELRIDPSEHNLLLTEPVQNPKCNRERAAELMFERYDFQGLNLSVPSVLSLRAEGLDTGVVVDSGDGDTHVVFAER